MYSSNYQDNKYKNSCLLYFNNCITSIKKWFTVYKSHNHKHVDPIGSTDLTGYLFADECDSCKHIYNIRDGHIQLDIGDKHPDYMDEYYPPLPQIVIDSGYESIDSSDSDDDLELSTSSIRHFSNGDSLEIPDNLVL